MLSKMKQYTSKEQTTKLVELGLPKPNGLEFLVREKDNPDNAQIIQRMAYSIGELIEMLPEVTCRSNNDDIHYYLTIYNDAMDWNIAYRDGDDELCYKFADELIDALYDMIIKLKEEGVI